MAMVYISIYRLPRNFLIHYVWGNGQTLNVNTQSLITRNTVVLNKLKNVLQLSAEKKQVSGFVDIFQTEIYQPGDRYSIGSFRLNFSRIDETVQLNIRSNYRYQESSDRITKHLHQWLFSFENKGKASGFAIEGNNWSVQINELHSTGTEQKTIPDLRGKLFV